MATNSEFFSASMSLRMPQTWSWLRPTIAKRTLAPGVACEPESAMAVGPEAISAKSRRAGNRERLLRSLGAAQRRLVKSIDSFLESPTIASSLFGLAPAMSRRDDVISAIPDNLLKNQ